MAKTIVNKHFETSEEIIREAFNEDIEIAKGEIAIHNGEKPSIYVLNNEGIPVKISGGGSSSSVDDDALTEFKEEVYAVIDANNEIITEAYTAADSALTEAYTAADETVVNTLTEKIDGVEQGYKDGDIALERLILEKEEAILEHTINNKAIKENPVLTAEDITVGKYSLVELPSDSKENVVTDDTTQVAIKKIENMVIANALAFSASLNDVNNKTKTYLKEIVLDGEEEIELEIGKLHVITEPITNLTIKLSKGDENNPIDSNILPEYLLMCSFNKGYILDLPEETEFSNMYVNNSTLENFKCVLFKFRYNYVEVIGFNSTTIDPA